MKILITTDLYKPLINGVITSVVNLTEELQERGHEVRILTVSQSAKTYKEGNAYYMKSIPLKIYPDVRMPYTYRNRYMRELIEWRPDVVHSQCEFFSFAFAKYIAEKTGAAIVHTYHTLYEQYASYVLKNQAISAKFISFMSRERLKYASVIIAPSRKVQDTLQEYGVGSPIAIVPTGISLQQYQARLTGEEIAKKRRFLNIGEQDKVLVSLGRLGYEKKVDELIRLFHPIALQDGSCKLLIVGDGPARGELMELAESLGIGEQVIFTGMVPSDRVGEYYQIGDVFVCASTSETQGLTYIEAVANGLPLVCREDPCLEGVILEGLNGYQYRSSEEFADSIHTVFADSLWRAGARQYSQEIAEHFGKQEFARKVEELYRQCAPGRELAGQVETETLQEGQGRQGWGRLFPEKWALLHNRLQRGI